MDELITWLNRASGLNTLALVKITLSLGTIIVLWIVRILFYRVIPIKTDDIRSRYLWQKTTKYIVFAIGVLALIRIWFEGAHNISLYFGLVSAGVAIALKDFIVNFVGWNFIIWARPLTVGDRIQIGTHSGDVIDIGIFHISLMEIGNWVDADQSTGRVIKIPNGMLFSETFANYSKGFQHIWNEIPVLITFESNWEKAKQLLLDIANRHTGDLPREAEKRLKDASMHLLIFYSKLTPTVYTSVKDSGILLTIRYLCEPRRRRGTSEAIWEDILRTFAGCNDIDFAYPTQRFFNNKTEGKEKSTT